MTIATFFLTSFLVEAGLELQISFLFRTYSLIAPFTIATHCLHFEYKPNFNDYTSCNGENIPTLYSTTEIVIIIFYLIISAFLFSLPEDMLMHHACMSASDFLQNKKIATKKPILFSRFIVSFMLSRPVKITDSQVFFKINHRQRKQGRKNLCAYRSSSS